MTTPQTPADALIRIVHELRTYNPAADEYKGEHIHKWWARELEPLIDEVRGYIEFLDVQNHRLRSQPEASARALAAIPEGFVLVPVEPTTEMVEAYSCGVHRVLPAYVGAKEKADARIVERWKAMLAAAPTPPTAPAQDAQGVRLQWVLNGDKHCGYNNWLAETAFGRILITWKGWKEDWNMGLSVDEFPGEIPVLHGSPDEVRDAAEQEFFRRVRAATPSPQAEKQPLSLDVIQAWAVRRTSALGPEGITDPVAFLEEGVRWGEAQHGIVTKEST